MKSIPLASDVWNKVTDHYYDSVHWERPGTLDGWVHDVWGGTVSFTDKSIQFESEARHDWFILRWL